MRPLGLLRAFVFPLLCTALFLGSLIGCGGGGGGGDGETPQMVSPAPSPPPPPPSPEPAPTLVNGTFSGDITTTQAGLDSVETINLTLAARSPLSGTFFRTGAQNVGTISGDAEVRSATFTGMSGGDCPDSFRGSMTLTDDNTLSVTMEGSNCNGQFTSAGILMRVECIDMAGNYRVSESGTVTCTVAGETDVENPSGTRTTLLEQNACNVRYTPPDINAPREGRIVGKDINFSGQFVFALEGELRSTQNVITFQGEISDESKFKLNGMGVATGTIDGAPFSCTGNSTAEFKRCFDVAVAVLRGGSATLAHLFDPIVFQTLGIHLQETREDEALNDIADIAADVRSTRVAARVFDAWATQIAQVQDWLQKLNAGCEKQLAAILVGYSLGGDGALKVLFPRVCSRIIIDHLDADLLPPKRLVPITNQRQEGPRLAPGDGQVFNFLAESPVFLVPGVDLFPLLGRRLMGSNVVEQLIPGTTHTSIVTVQAALPTILNEIMRCSR